jgi:5'-3' exonuclease
MGIPSYYKKLISNIPNLITKVHPDSSIQWLWMDFNCLIYHCLHRDDLPAFHTIDDQIEWENILIESVVKYCIKVVKQVAPTNGVFICIDGVVPMAKMRQQRLRRFKSIAMKHITPSSEKQWDTNAITPGTDFMKRLRIRLEKMITKHSNINWTLSSSDEPGEGEHKIIEKWRNNSDYCDNFAIYGLDADLIVLSILNRELNNLDNNIWLFREEIDAGQISRDSLGEEIFEWFSIHTLRNYLCRNFEDNYAKRKFIMDYCFAMSILGNDFLPSSLGLKIRDDGHSELIEIIEKMHNNETYLIDPDTYQISSYGLLELFNILSTSEYDRIANYINKKQMISRNLGIHTSNSELPIGDNNWPLCHIEENIISSGRRQLIDNWQQKYLTQWFPGFNYTPKSINTICAEYLYGIQWIWSYYTGDNTNISYNWYYPYRLPPLWSWLKEYITSNELSEFPGNVTIKAENIHPNEQLCMVLPLESWELIPNCVQCKLPIIAPQYFPSKFGFDSVGKRYFWECESEIPLISISEVKALFNNYV